MSVTRNVKEFTKLGIRQQSRRVKQLLFSQFKSAQSRTTVMNRPSVSGPSIIRIVPGRSKKGLKRNAKTVVIGRAAKTVKLEEAPSTSSSQVQSSPHKEDHRYGGEEVEEYQEFEVLADDNVEYLENDEVEAPKQVFIPVQQPSESYFSTIPDNINKVHSKECCCSCRETLNIIMKQQQEILKYLKRSDQGLLPMDRLLDLLPAMPFDDVNDFLDFDESLASNENVQDQFLIKIRRLLVSNEQKSISNIMASILTNELCRRVSWTGVKNSITFGTSNMVGLIIVSSKTEPQQQQQQQKPAAVVSELGTQSNSTSRRVIPSSPSESGSSEDSTEDDGGGDEDEDEAGGEEEEDDEADDGPDEEEGEDEASLETGDDEDDDEYEDELRALVSTTRKPGPNGDKEVSELLEYKRRKKESQQRAAKDKRVPTVKKELSSQKEILLADNETQVQSSSSPSSSSHPQQGEVVLVEPTAKESLKNELQETLPSYEEQREYSVVGPGELLRKQIKRQTALLNDLKAYLLDEYVAEREKLQELGAEEGLLAERLLKVLAENSGWRQFLTNVEANLDLSRQALETQKRLVQIANPFLQEVTSTLTTSMPPSADDRPTRKPKKKKKKKKKKLRHRNKPSTSATTSSITEATSSPVPPAVMATTETPWSSTQPSSDVKAKWRLVAERLFQQPWSQEDLREDESNVAKVRYSMPSKPRTLSPARRPLDDKERESLKALNSERQALMLKAAREYSQPRFVHFGKINTHQQTSSGEDLDDGAGYDANDRAYQRTHFGQLVSPSSSRLAYTRLREPIVPYPEQPPPAPPQYDVNFARNQEYLPPGREFAASKPWQAGNPFRGGSSDPPPKNLWNWRQFSNVPKPWLPWHSERDYFARLEQAEEETAKAWQQAQQRQQQQSWNRQNFRDNLPPWLEEKEVQRMFHAQDSWPKPDKSRDYGMHHKEDASTWENSRNNNNNSELKSVVDSKHEEESPKLTMKTWNSLTSDPATWPFKLPGAKPWPKDENGKSYNPNAELVRKLGLYSKNGRLRPEKDPLKELKQQKLQKSEKQGEPVQANDTRPWSAKAVPVTGSKWNEPEKQQPTWYNGMKIHDNFEDEHNPHWNSEKLPADAWNLAKAAAANWGSGWPNKWKQFAYHKVTAQPTSKSGVTLDKPGKNAFIAVSAVSSPRYGNEWRKNDIEEVGQVGPASTSIDPNDPTSQMRMNVWKKSSGFNETGALDKTPRIDALENQLEDLKEKEGPVLLEVNVSIRNSTFHQTSTPSSSTTSTSTEESKTSENKPKDDPTPKGK